MNVVDHIKLLPPYIANQIAAGEVVERPASIIKECLENSVDAGAKHIWIDIEEGGIRGIRIRDDGIGIYKEELELAVARHATSKIQFLEDLASIKSLGFRGEALASISAVSRFSICSKPKDQSSAFKYSEDLLGAKKMLSSVSHPEGTSIEIKELFYNTPARKRFLKSPRTEFHYIDDVVKRVALSHFEISIVLKHNNKFVRQLPSCNTRNDQEKRIAKICGQHFLDHAMTLESQASGIRLSGWLGSKEASRKTVDTQYFFLNGRMIRDKLISHAIKQSYTEFQMVNEGEYPSYVLYLEVDPSEVDVNVHPTKHEVRFSQGRWVHDFITQSLNSAFSQTSSCQEESSNNKINTLNKTLPLKKKFWGVCCTA